MKLYPPCKRTVWGEIKSLQVLIDAINKSGFPFGADESTGYPGSGLTAHKGVDIPCATGTEVYSSTAGKVVRISDNITNGIGVVIYDASQSIEVVYWHLKSHSVQLGDTVVIGQLIAISDNTGYSFGPHLHWQVNQTDAYGNSGNAIDPMPHLVWWVDSPYRRIIQKLYQSWLQDDSAGVEYWAGVVDSPEKLENFVDQKITDIKKAVNK